MSLLVWFCLFVCHLMAADEDHLDTTADLPSARNRTPLILMDKPHVEYAFPYKE